MVRMRRVLGTHTAAPAMVQAEERRMSRTDERISLIFIFIFKGFSCSGPG